MSFVVISYAEADTCSYTCNWHGDHHDGYFKIEFCENEDAVVQYIARCAFTATLHCVVSSWKGTHQLAKQRCVEGNCQHGPAIRLPTSSQESDRADPEAERALFKLIRRVDDRYEVLKREQEAKLKKQRDAETRQFENEQLAAEKYEYERLKQKFEPWLGVVKK